MHGAQSGVSRAFMPTILTALLASPQPRTQNSLVWLDVSIQQCILAPFSQRLIFWGFFVFFPNMWISPIHSNLVATLQWSAQMLCSTWWRLTTRYAAVSLTSSRHSCRTGPTGGIQVQGGVQGVACDAIASMCVLWRFCVCFKVRCLGGDVLWVDAHACQSEVEYS